MNRCTLLVAWALLSAFVLPAAAQTPRIEKGALVRFHSPSLGDSGAKVEIVEFFDPACEGCAAFYPFVKRLLDEHRGRVRLKIRYLPFHKGADQIVKLLEAARRQGKYIETLDILIANQAQWAIHHTARLDLALKVVGPVGLQMEKLKVDMAAPELAQLIEQDIKDAVALDIDRTPTFFVNGKPLTKLGYKELQAMVQQALRESYGAPDTK